MLQINSSKNRDLSVKLYLPLGQQSRSYVPYVFTTEKNQTVYK